MAQFYGSVKGNRKEVHRLSGKHYGLTTIAAGWEGCIRVNIYYNASTERDEYSVYLEPWQKEGQTKLIAEGVLCSNV